MSEIKTLTNLDYPDPDVIRVGDTYYMASTTMHFMPGCDILISKDLVNWEHLCYVYDVLEDTAKQRLEDGMNAYGKGMWAPTLRFHKGKFYLCFVANDVHKTFVYIADDILGPWKKQYIEGFYHDPSLFFDDDDRIYIVYGNTQIHMTELEADLSKPKAGGFDRVIVKEPKEHPGYLGYEGAHFYKINGRYYVFLIHWPPKEHYSRRTEACFTANSLEDEFVGGDVFDEDGGYDGQGIAQGGIVDTPNGEWYAILFQDRGAVGRIPHLVPVTFENTYPVFGKGHLPQTAKGKQAKENPLITSDFFERASVDEKHPILKGAWQWNHIPDQTLWEGISGELCKAQGQTLTLRTAKVLPNLTQAKNTLTQRALWPRCTVEVTVDTSGLSEGDYAGIAAFQSNYGWIGVGKEEQGVFITTCKRGPHEPQFPRDITDGEPGVFQGRVSVTNNQSVRLRIHFEFANPEGTHPVDRATFFYWENDGWKMLGDSLAMRFSLDHFTGNRIALFLYSTKTAGGSVTFSKFQYLTD